MSAGVGWATVTFVRTRIRLSLDARLHRIGSGALLALGALALGCRMPWSDPENVTGPDACFDWSSAYRVTTESCPGWSPDGHEMVGLAARDPNGVLSFGVYLVDLRAGAWRKLAPSSGFRFPRTALWHPHERKVLLSYDPGIDILDVESGSLTTLSDGSGQWAYRARWSPEGDSVWYFRADGLHVMPATGGTQRLAIPFSSRFAQAGGWSFSPDGQTIAYAQEVREANGVDRYRWEICLTDRSGRSIRELTHLAGNARNPLWIHGGREILFDWADTLCVNRANRPERQWFAVDVATGRVRSLGDYLGTEKYQFSFPIGVDFAGERAAVVGGNKTRGDYVDSGVLYWTPIERPVLTRVFRPGSPEMP